MELRLLWRAQLLLAGVLRALQAALPQPLRIRQAVTDTQGVCGGVQDTQTHTHTHTSARVVILYVYVLCGFLGGGVSVTG